MQGANTSAYIQELIKLMNDDQFFAELHGKFRQRDTFSPEVSPRREEFSARLTDFVKYANSFSISS